MPLYEYAPTARHCEQCADGFEVMQRISDNKLTQCPSCGQACERQISRVALGGKFSTSEAAIKSSGFTRDQKAENGVYERTAGAGGPEILYLITGIGNDHLFLPVHQGMALGDIIDVAAVPMTA